MFVFAKHSRHLKAYNSNKCVVNYVFRLNTQDSTFWFLKKFEKQISGIFSPKPI